MNRTEQAVHYFEQGYLCSQSILATFAPQSGFDQETAFRIAAGFGAGMGRMGEVCGALTGAFMVIGLRFGHTSGEDMVNKDLTYQHVQMVADQFRNRHGTILCRELIGCDLNTPEGQEAFKVVQASGGCGKYVAMAARTAVELLDKDR